MLGSNITTLLSSDVQDFGCLECAPGGGGQNGRFDLTPFAVLPALAPGLALGSRKKLVVQPPQEAWNGVRRHSSTTVTWIKLVQLALCASPTDQDFPLRVPVVPKAVANPFN